MSTNMNRATIAGSAVLALALFGGHHVVLGSSPAAESGKTAASAQVGKTPTTAKTKKAMKSAKAESAASAKSTSSTGRSKTAGNGKTRSASFGGGNGGMTPPQQQYGGDSERQRELELPPDPEQRTKYWAWQAPLGDEANNNPHIIRMVRRSCHREGEVLAQQVANWILQQDLTEEQACVVLMNFGHGGAEPTQEENPFPGLFLHWCDGLPHQARPFSTDCEPIAPQDAVGKWWRTPWMSHGIAESRAWIDAFVAKYKELQAANPAIPDPGRFHFDVENAPVPYVLGSIEVFDAMRSDPRWYSEPVPGWNGQTMEQLYVAAGSPPYDVTRRFNHEPNRELVEWYIGVVKQACDGALNEAAYIPLQEAFPNTKCSNYGTSDRYDGGGTPERVWRTPQWGHEAQFDSFGSMRAPVVYNGEPDAMPPGMSWREGTILECIWDLDSNIHSYGGNAWNIVAWIQAYGHSGLAKDDITPIFIDADLSRGMLALLRAKGIPEVALWSDNSTQQDDEAWTMMSRLINDTWQVNLRSYEVANGRDLTHDTTALRYSRRDPLQVESKRDAGGDIATAVIVKFDADLTSASLPERLEIVIESSITEPTGDVCLLMRNWETGSFDLLTKDAARVPYLAYVDHNAAQHISPEGHIEVLVRHVGRSKFIALIDSVEVYPTSAVGTPRVTLASKMP